MKEYLYCLGCLCHNSERDLEDFKFHNETCKALFSKSIYLCFVCKKIAFKMEYFVKSVHHNQLVMEIFQTISDTTIKSASDLFKPIVNLSKVTLSSIETNDASYIDEPVSIVYNNSVVVQIKPELVLDNNHEPDDINDFQNSLLKKEDDNTYNDIKNEDGLENINLTIPSTKLEKRRTIDNRIKGRETDNDFQNSLIKKEDDNIYNDTKNEADLENINLKIPSTKLVKRRTINNRIKGRKTNNDCIITVLQITEKEFNKERENMLKDPRYTKRVYKCENCVKGFTFKKPFEKHMEKHSKAMGEFECDVCKQRMATSEKLWSHQRYHKIRYKCAECGLVGASRLTITEHYTEFHVNKGPRLSCPQCHIKFRSRLSLKKHIANLHRKKTRTCSYCLKTYASYEVLKGHMIREHAFGTIPHSLVCSECGRGFSDLLQLRNHMAKHFSDRNFLCVECDRSFKSDSSLKRHLKYASPHVKNENLPFSCSHCDKRFNMRRNVARHENRVHLNIKPFQCDKCDKAYINNWSFKDHKSYVHEGRKRTMKFPCPYCDKIFGYNAHCKTHIRIHTGERPYSCKACPARFKSSSELSSHNKTVHLRLTHT